MHRLKRYVFVSHFWNRATARSNACNFGCTYRMKLYEVLKYGELPNASRDIKHLPMIMSHLKITASFPSACKDTFFAYCILLAQYTLAAYQHLHTQNLDSYINIKAFALIKYCFLHSRQHLHAYKHDSYLHNTHPRQPLYIGIKS